MYSAKHGTIRLSDSISATRGGRSHPVENNRLQRIQALNPHIPIHSAFDDAFRPFGRVLAGFDFSELIGLMEHKDVPADGNVYVASDPELEHTSVRTAVQNNLYGAMDIQIGYCNGRNSTLNGLEYHKCSEINIAATDLVLLLGRVQDIRRNQYAAEQVLGFYLPRGTAVELYQTTLHFAPCKLADDGFKCIVILTRGTNEPLTGPVERVSEEDELLFMRNKWLLAHPERKALIERGAYPGIAGSNIEIRYDRQNWNEE